MNAPLASPAERFVDALVRAYGRDAHQRLLNYLASLSNIELAALAHDWERTWARPKQRIPTEGTWRSWGFLTGRGFGKTRAAAEFIISEVMAGRARRIALVAQSEEKTEEVMVDGKSGLIATSPPWFPAEVYKGRVVWPNGAIATVYTPESPGGLRGPEHDLAWCTEFVAWPKSTRDEAFSNLRYGLRLGYGRLIWDTTPKRRHPLIRRLLKRAEKHPDRHVIVRGSMYENAANLTPDLIEELEEEFGGTQQGREELHGEFFDDSDGALWKQEWIDRARREMPASLARRILSLDPAISTKKGTDRTGLVDLGTGGDGQIYILADLSAKRGWEEWGKLVVRRYFETSCDCVVVERNRGGDAVVANLRASARDPELLRDLGLDDVDVVVLAQGAPTRHVPGTIYVREVTASQSKAGRHESTATVYERGRVSHVVGVDLSSLEDWLTTWEPTPGSKSPDSIDALTQGVWELAGMGDKGIDRRRGFSGLAKVSEALGEVVRGGGGAEGLIDALGTSDIGSKI